MDHQRALADRAEQLRASDPWTPGAQPLIAACFVTVAPHPGAQKTGLAGDLAWAAAVAWRPGLLPLRRDATPYRRGDVFLRASAGPIRRAHDVEAQALVTGRAPAPYVPGLLARREGPLLAAAVLELGTDPDVLVVDATGLDHPRMAGLAVDLGAAIDLPTVGVTNRPLVGSGDFPPLVRGASSPLLVDGKVTALWVCTRTGARPVLAHAGWRTTTDTAAALVLMASTEAARTPIPLQEARRLAREARVYGFADLT